LRLLFHTAGVDREDWIDALQRAMPEARIDAWTAGGACEADYALLWKPPPALVEELRGVRAIFNLGAGVDSIPDLALPLPHSVPLVRLDDAGMAEQMVEYVVHAVLRHYREFDAYAEQQRRGLWQPRSRRPKTDFTIGVLGAGVLGTAVAGALAALHFPVRTWSRARKAVAGVTSFAGMPELDEFLSATRLLVCLLPLTRETEGLLDRARLSRLPRGAYLVNVARGALVLDADLLLLLDDGHLAGATLDVFRDEPLPREHPFWHHPHVVLTPHVSAVTLVEESVQQIADKIRRLEAGLPVSGVVDRARGY
jgi:glyoxylate/hydroxypyruvate reductase A